MLQFGFQLELVPDAEGRQVLARLVAAFNPAPLHLAAIKSRLQESGFGQWFPHEDAMTGLLNLDADLREKGQRILDELRRRLETQTGAEAGAESSDAPAIPPEQILALLNVPAPEAMIAEKRDAEIQITVAEDGLTAWLTVFPACGGEPADVLRITAAASALGIQTSVDTPAIEQAVTLGRCDRLVLARGVPARRGRDSAFEALVASQISSGPSIDERGIADYRSLGEFVVVEPGQALMRRHPPTAGKAGMDVLGRAIPAEPGDLLPFFGGIEGAAVSPEDVNLLVASRKGHPLIHDRGVSVDPVLQLRNVSLATGNIDFDGSVHVHEDVADGMTVRATGDVIVDGVVGKATIHAGYDVVIQQGLIGGVIQEDASPQPDVFGAIVECGARCSARFASQARVRARNEIVIVEYAIHCDLEAGQRIVIGPKGGKGTLIGGTARAFDLVFAKTLGSVGSAVTHVRVGAPPDTLDRLRHITQQARQKDTQIAELRENLFKLERRARIAELPAQAREVMERLRQQIAELESALGVLLEEEGALKSLLMQSKKARVKARERVYQNVTVAILGASRRSREDGPGGEFRFDQRQVLFGPGER